ncbi:MAG: hypothetical protein IJA35_00720 [Clostridia bacterium]|nr:hypothetical protein [Clostridia bacterium]
MEYFIGIASYKRADNQKTLDYLEKLGFPKDRLILSVQTAEDMVEYERHGTKARVGSFLYREANSAAGNRNTILDYLPEGLRVVLMDDDISGVDALDHAGRLRPIETLAEFDAMVERAFELTDKFKTVCFGLYPVGNAYFMSDDYRRRNIVTAAFMGLTVTDARFNDAIKTKEDFELCCRIIRKYGACVRLNGYAIRTGKSKGGCEEVWKDRAAAERVAELLCAKYPDIVRPNPRRKGEILMATQKKKKGRAK